MLGLQKLVAFVFFLLLVGGFIVGIVFVVPKDEKGGNADGDAENDVNKDAETPEGRAGRCPEPQIHDDCHDHVHDHRQCLQNSQEYGGNPGDNSVDEVQKRFASHVQYIDKHVVAKYKDENVTISSLKGEDVELRFTCNGHFLHSLDAVLAFFGAVNDGSTAANDHLVKFFGADANKAKELIQKNDPNLLTLWKNYHKYALLHADAPERPKFKAGKDDDLEKRLFYLPANIASVLKAANNLKGKNRLYAGRGFRALAGTPVDVQDEFSVQDWEGPNGLQEACNKLSVELLPLLDVLSKHWNIFNSKHSGNLKLVLEWLLLFKGDTNLGKFNVWAKDFEDWLVPKLQATGQDDDAQLKALKNVLGSFRQTVAKLQELAVDNAGAEDVKPTEAAPVSNAQDNGNTVALKGAAAAPAQAAPVEYTQALVHTFLEVVFGCFKELHKLAYAVTGTDPQPVKKQLPPCRHLLPPFLDFLADFIHLLQHDAKVAGKQNESAAGNNISPENEGLVQVVQLVHHALGVHKINSSEYYQKLVQARDFYKFAELLLPLFEPLKPFLQQWRSQVLAELGRDFMQVPDGQQTN